MSDTNIYRNRVTGPISSVSTPFTEDGEIDEQALRKCVDFAVEEADSSTVLLTYGDSLYTMLSDTEVSRVTRIVVEQVAGRKLVVAAGSWWLGQALEFANYCVGLGADMFMPLPPNWVGSASEQGLVHYFDEISKVLPVMVVTALGPGVPLPLSVVARLVESENGIVAIKDDICGPYGRRLAHMTADKWAFMSGGRKENHLDQYPYGAGSYLSLYMRFKPDIARKYWAQISSGDVRAAAETIDRYDIPFMTFCADNGLHFDAVVRGSMELFGVAARWRRRPYSNLTESDMDKLRAFYHRLGIGLR